MKDMNTQIKLIGFILQDSKYHQKAQSGSGYVLSSLYGKLSLEQMVRLLKISPLGENESQQEFCIHINI
jgi:hypothetical protein